MLSSPKATYLFFFTKVCFSFSRSAFLAYLCVKLIKSNKEILLLGTQVPKALEWGSLFIFCYSDTCSDFRSFSKNGSYLVCHFSKKTWSHYSCAKQPLSVLFHFTLVLGGLKRGNVIRFQLSLLSSEMLTFPWGKMNSSYVGFLSQLGLWRKSVANSD